MADQDLTEAERTKFDEQVEGFHVISIIVPGDGSRPWLDLGGLHPVFALGLIKEAVAACDGLIPPIQVNYKGKTIFEPYAPWEPLEDTGEDEDDEDWDDEEYD